MTPIIAGKRNPFHTPRPPQAVQRAPAAPDRIAVSHSQPQHTRARLFVTSKTKTAARDKRKNTAQGDAENKNTAVAAPAATQSLKAGHVRSCVHISVRDHGNVYRLLSRAEQTSKKRSIHTSSGSTREWSMTNTSEKRSDGDREGRGDKLGERAPPSVREKQNKNKNSKVRQGMGSSVVDSAQRRRMVDTPV